MSFSFQLGCSTGWNTDYSKYDFFVVNYALTKNKCYSLSKQLNKPTRTGGLWGSYDTPLNPKKFPKGYNAYIQSLIKQPCHQIELVNEFIRDDGSLTFPVEHIKSWVDQCKVANKYVLISDFKAWNNSRWKTMNSVASYVKPDGVGIQLHLKFNFNAEIVLIRLPTIIRDLQDRGVDVHFSEVSVWKHKRWIGDPQSIWDKIVEIADKFEVKSVTPWFHESFDGQFMPSFSGWKIVEF